MRKEEEDIVCFKFIYIKPLTRSQGGSTMNIGFLVALESGIIKLYDLYGNLLYQLETNAQILFLDTSPHMEGTLTAVAFDILFFPFFRNAIHVRNS